MMNTWREDHRNETASRVASTIAGDSDSNTVWNANPNASLAYSTANHSAVGLAQSVAQDALTGTNLARDVLASGSLAHRVADSPGLLARGVQGINNLTHGAVGPHGFRAPPLVDAAPVERFASRSNLVMAPLGLAQGLIQTNDGASRMAHGDMDGLVDVLGGTAGTISSGIGTAGLVGSALSGLGATGAGGAITAAVAGGTALGTTAAVAASAGAGLAIGSRGNEFARQNLSGVLGRDPRSGQGRSWSDWAADGAHDDRQAWQGLTHNDTVASIAGGASLLGRTAVGAVGAAGTGVAGIASDAYHAGTGLAQTAGHGISSAARTVGHGIASGASSLWHHFAG